MLVATLILGFSLWSGAKADTEYNGDNALMQMQTSQYPPISEWRPEGDRLASSEELTGPVPSNYGDRFTTLHGNGRNSDTVNIAFAPVFGETFTVEERAFVPEGPTFLEDGTILFTPAAPLLSDDSTTNHLVIALDGTTGQRLWTVDPGQVGQGGAPLILRDPDTKREVVYATGLEKAVAVDGITGEIVWETTTGLNIDPEDRCFGMNYHPQTDSVLAIFLSGKLLAYNRATGDLVATVSFVDDFGVAPTSSSLTTFQNVFSLDQTMNGLLQEYFDVDPSAASPTMMFSVIFGQGTILANFFSIDPNSGAIYVIASLPDGHEGDWRKQDGKSTAAALYRLSLTLLAEGEGSTNQARFGLYCVSDPIENGSASTPTVSADGQRIYAANSSSARRSRFLAFNPECENVYSVPSRRQILGSVTASPFNREIYAQAYNGVLKFVEDEDRMGATIDEDFVQSVETNLENIFRGARPLEATVFSRGILEVINASVISCGANGLMILVGCGLTGPREYALVLLDRGTGKIINVSRAREESISALSVSPNGQVALGNSPARALLDWPFLNSLNADLPTAMTGGITMYGVRSRHDLIVRDASCASADQLANMLAYLEGQQDLSETLELSRQADTVDVLRLIEQAERGLEMAVGVGEFSSSEQSLFSDWLTSAKVDVNEDRLESAQTTLSTACVEFLRD